MNVGNASRNGNRPKMFLKVMSDANDGNLDHPDARNLPGRSVGVDRSQMLPYRHKPRSDLMTRGAAISTEESFGESGDADRSFISRPQIPDFVDEFGRNRSSDPCQRPHDAMSCETVGAVPKLLTRWKPLPIDPQRHVLSKDFSVRSPFPRDKPFTVCRSS